MVLITNYVVVDVNSKITAELKEGVSLNFIVVKIMIQDLLMIELYQIHFTFWTFSLFLNMGYCGY